MNKWMEIGFSGKDFIDLEITNIENNTRIGIRKEKNNITDSIKINIIENEIDIIMVENMGADKYLIDILNGIKRQPRLSHIKIIELKLK